MSKCRNAANYFVDRHIEEGRGDKVAFQRRMESDELTYMAGG
ncbi:MAG: hypothetical protein R3D81_07710 [Thalassovita sp.]